jgi:hypothetical protein
MDNGEPTFVRSLGWHPGYDDEFQNGRENNIHIRIVYFRFLEMFKKWYHIGEF